MKEIMSISLLFLISIVAFIISVRSFQEKGFLFNNAWLYASKQERECMDKKPHYRQSAIVFLMLGIAFLFYGIGTLWKVNWIFCIAIGIMIATILYAIVSSVVIATRKSKNNKKILNR